MSVNCRDIEVVPGCRRYPDGTTSPVLIHVQYGTNSAGGTIVVATRYTDAASNPITLGAGETVEPGSCGPVMVGIVSDGVQIAGPDRAALAPFSGAAQTFSTSVVPGHMQSITVTAASVLDGLPGQTADQIIMVTPAGTKIALLNGETKSFSVVRGHDQELKREFEFEATGLAYATITWTAN